VELICFFHPRIKGFRADERCPECGRSFGFPVLNHPLRVADFDVEEVLGRGFYSVVLRVRHVKTGVLSALKVSPVAVYEQPDPDHPEIGGYGDRRDFEQESHTHVTVSDLPQVVAILNWGRSEVLFGPDPLEVYWTQMDLVRGSEISALLNDENAPTLSPRSIAQVAEDLLTLSASLVSRNIFHNDLHPGNAVVIALPTTQFRQRAIDPSIAVKVFDLGSASRRDLSNDRRLDDLEQIANQIHRLLDRYELTDDGDALSSDVRLAAQLRRVAQFYARDDLASRRLSASDMLDAVRRAFEFAIHPEQQRPLALQTVGDHYNAQTLPSEFAGLLMHDPGGRWTREVTSAGPQLLVGMRGCGKTMLLRSLEWAANAVVGITEDRTVAHRRLADLPYLGLFVSCAYLLRESRQRVGAGALHRLFLAYGREAIRAAGICEAKQLGNIDYDAVSRLFDLMRVVDPMIESQDPLTLPYIERTLSRAIQRESPSPGLGALSPLEAFSALARAVRELVDIWNSKTILYLLDDVSKRYVHEDSLADLLTQFSLKDESFGFKISTETQTQLLFTPSGAPAIRGRDYKVFDLGAEVLRQLRGAKGALFLEQVLAKRQDAVTNDELPPRDLLGLGSLNMIAESLRDGTNKRSSYHGLRALAAVCVGDIGDVIHLYQNLVSTNGGRARISPRRQHDTLVNESDARLQALVPLDQDNPSDWHYAHAAAFAQASHRELKRSDRLRQHGGVFVEIAGDDKEKFRMLTRLVDNGVYVIVGFRQRTKRAGHDPIWQFGLKFRMLLGLRFGIPLSSRDRFELFGSQANSWLEDPKSESFTSLEPTPTDWGFEGYFSADDDIDDEDDGVVDLVEERSVPPLPETSQQTLDLFGMPELAQPVAAGSRVARTTEVPLVADSLSWEVATLIVADGFEDRAVGAWGNYSGAIGRRLQRAIVLQYPASQNSDAVLQLAAQNAREVEAIPVDASNDPTALLEEIAQQSPASPLVIDVSAMTKPLIYGLVRSRLLLAREVWVIHTAAKVYEPSADDLRPAMAALQQGRFTDGLRLLDQVTPGDGVSFSPITLGPQSVEGSSRTLLAAFVTLKHRRLDALLQMVASDRVVGVRTVHSASSKHVRSRVIDQISKYQISSINGSVRQVAAMDAQATYEVLSEYYEQYVLDDSFRMEIGLTGTKMQTVGAAMFGAVARPASVYYVVSHGRDEAHFTHGTGASKLFRLSLDSRSEFD
jgi:serine/threonine protein kinase